MIVPPQSSSFFEMFGLVLIFCFLLYSLPSMYIHKIEYAPKPLLSLNTISGFFSSKCYLLSNPDVQIRYNEDEAWTHYQYYGHKEGRPIGLVSTNFPDVCFIGYFDDQSYVIMHKSEIATASPLDHYVSQGHQNDFEIALKDFYRINILDDFEFLHQPKIIGSRPSVLLLSHSWGGGTELFEHEMIQTLRGRFNIYTLRLVNSIYGSSSFKVNNMESNPKP